MSKLKEKVEEFAEIATVSAFLAVSFSAQDDRKLNFPSAVATQFTMQDFTDFY